ncbi:MAG: 2'-5' RNA ligase family protein [Cyanothece sp. SIO1E1]|nr:2'-5' RNA ligase family protein [Cyanothece sp. SIO1E1]
MSKQTDLFFIAVLPPMEIQQEVTEFKKEAAAQFDSRHALRSPPHITLIPPFRWPSSDQESLNRCLGEFRFDSSYFSICLKNFDCFAPRVIFVDVEAEPLLVQLQSQLAASIERDLGVKHKGPFGFHPHMTIAFRDLEQKTFPRAWEYFSQKEYQRSFAVQQLTLLVHRPSGWQENGTFPLAN